MANFRLGCDLGRYFEVEFIGLRDRVGVQFGYEVVARPRLRGCMNRLPVCLIGLHGKMAVKLSSGTFQI